MENLIKMDDLGVPLFLETPISLPCCNLMDEFFGEPGPIFFSRITDVQQGLLPNPKERLVFQPSFFRGELLNFGSE